MGRDVWGDGWRGREYAGMLGGGGGGGGGERVELKRGGRRQRVGSEKEISERGSWRGRESGMGAKMRIHGDD